VKGCPVGNYISIVRQDCCPIYSGNIMSVLGVSVSVSEQNRRGR